MDGHFPERQIPDATRSTAQWARDPTGKVFLFVHGYGGNAIGSWSEFNVRLPDEASCRKADIIFYGYNGIRADVISSASLLFRFLDRMVSSAPDFVNSTLPASARRPSSFSFQEIVIVAHSLGAVITRWALLFAHDNQRDWLNRTRFVLFAPAHTGANVARLATWAFSRLPIALPLTALYKFYSPLVDQLEPGSEILQYLEQRTTAAIAAGALSLRPVRVFIAEYENIVTNLPFGGDPSPIAFDGTNHFSICKPRAAFTRPVEELVAAI
jgi:triacylglycerol esterase/lipase EstA (alpha/beta hydrolase family)